MKTLKDRWSCKTPTFWKKVQRIGLVAGGFYVALYNGSGTTATIQGSAGILIQNTFQKPVNF